MFVLNVWNHLFPSVSSVLKVISCLDLMPVFVLQSLTQLTCSYEADNQTRYVLCDLGNPLKPGTSVRTSLFVFGSVHKPFSRTDLSTAVTFIHRKAFIVFRLCQKSYRSSCFKLIMWNRMIICVCRCGLAFASLFQDWRILRVLSGLSSRYKGVSPILQAGMFSH